MSDKKAQTNQQPEELSDEALEDVAGGANLGNLGQTGAASNSGIGAAVNLQVGIENLIDVPGLTSGSLPKHHS